MRADQKKAGVLLGYAGEAVKALTALLYTPVLLRFLGDDEYGLYQMVIAMVANLSLLSLGFGSAYVRYHSRYQVKNDHQGIARLNGMFMIVFCVMAGICLLCGAYMVWQPRQILGGRLSGELIARSRILLAILVVSMAVSFPNSVYVCYITAQEKFIFQKLLNLLQSLFNPLVTLPLLMLGYGSVAAVAVSAGLTVAAFLANLWYCKKKLGMKFSYRGLEFGLLKEMWVFTFFIFLNQIVDQVNWAMGKLLLGRMVSPAAVTVYSHGAQINTLFIQMSTAVSAVFVPQVNNIVAGSNDDRKLSSLMIRVGRVQFLILMLIVTGFLFFGQAFIEVWVGPGCEVSYIVALLLMGAVAIPLMQNLGIEIQRAKNKHMVRSVVYTCLALGNVGLSIVFIGWWGCVGAAMGTAVSLILGNVLFMNWYYQKKLGLDMIAFWKEIIRFVPALAVICLFGWGYTRLVPVSGWLMLGASACVFTAVYALVMWLLGMNGYEKQIVRKMLGRFSRKGRQSH